MAIWLRYQQLVCSFIIIIIKRKILTVDILLVDHPGQHFPSSSVFSVNFARS